MRCLGSPDAPQPQAPHEAFDRAAGDVSLPVPLGDQGPVQHDVHLAGPERRVVLSMNGTDLVLEDLVAPGAW